MKEHDVWLDIQPMAAGPNELALLETMPSHVAEKFEQMTEGAARAYALGQEHGLKMTFGTDILFSPESCEGQGELLTRLVHDCGFSPADALRHATSLAGELLALCGQGNPCPDGPLGVVREGAYADLLIVDANPLEDIDLVADPYGSFRVVMKDGRLCKNTLD